MNFLIELLLEEKKRLSERLNKVVLELEALGHYDKAGSDDIVKEPSKEIVIEKKPVSKSEYKGLTTKQQIAEVVKKYGRFLYNYEITEELKAFQGEFSDEDFKRKIAGELGKIRDENKNFIKIQYGNSKIDTVWGLQSWLDEDGNIKPEHLYKLREKPAKVSLDL